MKIKDTLIGFDFLLSLLALRFYLKLRIDNGEFGTALSQRVTQHMCQLRETLKSGSACTEKDKESGYVLLLQRLYLELTLFPLLERSIAIFMKTEEYDEEYLHGLCTEILSIMSWFNQEFSDLNPGDIVGRM